jgi:ectoine hydroxylase-related dioxygenase (phytanoyl-CoA dioxygenase family)
MENVMDKLYFEHTADRETVASSYHHNGVVVIKNLIDEKRLTSLRELALRVVYTRARSAGIDLPAGLTLDDAFNRMCAINRSLGGNVYDCLRHHPEAVKLITSRSIVDYIELLLGTQDVYYAIDQIHFRIDRRHEERFSLPWHQDYWWNNTSRTAISVWYSLVDVPLELGPMRFLLGSHKEVAKIRVDPNYKISWDQNRLFEIAEPVNEDLGVDIPVAAGDVVFLSALALHRSGINRSERNRWTVVTRYAEMFDPGFVAKGWKSGIRVGHLSILETDPGCIVNAHEIVEPAPLVHR